MPSNTQITAQQLAKLVGTPGAPIIVEVRTQADRAQDSRMLPAAQSRDPASVDLWANDFTGKSVVVVCQNGKNVAQGVAAWLRHNGVEAETLAGGFEGWRDSGGLLVRTDRVPVRNAGGRSVWVTRARPKIDRIACPWLIRRFIDPKAVFLFVDAAEVTAAADQFQAAPFDIDDVFWSHRGDQCTFDVMITEFGLKSGPLDQLASIVRAADTDRLDLAPQAAGLLAVSLGLSRTYRDDLKQLDAGMLIYDALYRWCRDATAETHN